LPSDPEIKLIGWGFLVFPYISARRSLNALPTTDTELKLTAAASK
jgi:hypothetical protein